MGTEETKGTTATANNNAENNVTTTQNIAYGEEKIKADEEDEISSRQKNLRMSPLVPPPPPRPIQKLKKKKML
jgi:hypothetical protein